MKNASTSCAAKMPAKTPPKSAFAGSSSKMRRAVACYLFRVIRVPDLFPKVNISAARSTTAACATLVAQAKASVASDFKAFWRRNVPSKRDMCQLIVTDLASNLRGQHSVTKLVHRYGRRLCPERPVAAWPPAPKHRLRAEAEGPEAELPRQKRHWHPRQIRSESV